MVVYFIKVSNKNSILELFKIPTKENKRDVSSTDPEEILEWPARLKVDKNVAARAKLSYRKF